MFYNIVYQLSMDSQMNSLIWSMEDRSIGFCDPNEQDTYIPIIGWNFDIVNYVSHPVDHYCAFIVKI